MSELEAELTDCPGSRYVPNALQGRIWRAACKRQVLPQLRTLVMRRRIAPIEAKRMVQVGVFLVTV
jgi:hypothetical protein